MSWVTLVVLLAGFGSGVLASILGIGGTVVTTPMIRALGATAIHSIGSTVPAILPGALSGCLRYHREGFILWRIALICGSTGMVSAILGGWVSDQVNAEWLMVLTAVIVTWVGISLLREALRSNNRDRVAIAELGVDALDERIESTVLRGETFTPRGGLGALLLLGIGGGLLAGLLGMGGGMILTPGLTVGLRLPVKNAIATSLTAVAMMSSTSVITHIWLGHVDWAYAIPLMVGIVPGARFGARLTVGSSEERMRLLAGVLLILVGIATAVNEFIRMR